MTLAATLLIASPALAQPVTGTTPTGIFYEVSGAGEPVVFIHAFSVDRRMWARQVASFESRFRIVRYDLRGHGRSAAPSGPYAGYEDLREVLDTLRIPRATLVGLSAGSEVATNFALAYPNRVTRLILASPGLGGYRIPPLPWAPPCPLQDHHSVSVRSEEHTSELQSHHDLVCRLLLEKKKYNTVRLPCRKHRGKSLGKSRCNHLV